MSHKEQNSLLQTPSLQLWMARLQPKHRGECRGGQRPCPHVTCTHHLYLRSAKSGELSPCHQGKEIWELVETCRLDIQEREQTSLTDPPLQCHGPQEMPAIPPPRKPQTSIQKS